MESKYTVLNKASFRPNKIVFYQQFVNNLIDHNTPKIVISAEAKAIAISMGVGKLRAVAVNKHDFEISKKASGRIKEKVSWLYELAKNKTVTTHGGKVLFSFKMNFITLTLPATQSHETAQLTKECLGQFLTECKTKFNLQNYVWRLEFQKNGNAHYHLATDTYIDYTSCKLIWNRCLAKLGYISAYQAKFENMSFAEYLRDYSNNGKTDFNTMRERYGRGRATRWDSPNTVDVKAVSNAKNIAFYISKYITKKSEHSLNPIVMEREPKESNLRLWFCSKSLSALDKIEIFMDGYSDLVHDVLSGIENAKKFIFDYCSIWYFNGKEQISETKRLLWLLYREYANERNYIPAS